MPNDGRQPVTPANRPSRWWGLMAAGGSLYLLWGLLALGGVWERLDATGVSLGVVLIVTATLLVGYSRLSGFTAFRFPLLPVMGLIDLFAGIALLLTSARWVAPVSVVVGVWAIVRGIVDGIGALDLRRAGFGRWRPWFYGAVAAMAFGFFVLAGRIAAAVDVTAWIAIAVITIGLATLGLSLALRRASLGRVDRIEPPDEPRRVA
jgi:uncharacterized membrane protein HdeD (DUF308 family)